MTRRQHDGAGPACAERGSESVELAILLPVMFLVLAVLVVGVRITSAANRISGVAGIAAREASLARSSGAAEQLATAAAVAALDDRQLHCTDLEVSVDVSGFAAAPGAAAAVTVEVSCTVDLADIGVAGLPGSRALRDTASSPLDPARDIS